MTTPTEIDGQLVVGFNPLIIRGTDGEPGRDGLTPTLTIGSVTVGTPAVTLTGAAPNYELNFEFPAAGTGSVASVSGVSPGTNGNVDLSSTYQPLIKIVLPAPSGVAATDDAALSTAITAAGSSGLIEARAGTYLISTWHVIPDGVDLLGQGGGSVSRGARTTFQCTTSVAGIEFAGGGGTSGEFRIDGNLTATTPHKRSGGTGANNRVFRKKIILNNAVSGSHSNDLSLIQGAQNDSWYDCGWAGADRDARVFDQGYGGANFYNCKVNTAGRYADHYQNTISGGPYSVPTQIQHWGGIIEGNIGTSAVRGDAEVLVSYAAYQFYSGTAPSGPMIDIESGCSIALIGQTYLQSTPSTQTAGTVGIRITGTGQCTLSGYAQFQNFATGIVVDGVQAFLYPYAFALFPNCGTAVGGTNSGSALQVARLQLGPDSWAASAATAIELNYNAARTAFLSARTADGTLDYYPGTGFGTPDTVVGRTAAGVWGVKAAGYVLQTGSGTTSARPAGSIPKGSSFFDTTLGKPVWATGSGTWVDATGATV